MPWDLSPRLPRAGSEGDVVVLVHGFMATAGVFRPLAARLANELGVETASFTHAPGFSVDRIGRSLANLIERIPANRRVHLVGHSLGGVAARWYVQELGGDARVTQTISLASPFFGTTLATPFPVLVGRDLSRQSRVLLRLRARAERFDHVPHLSVVATGDAVVRPHKSARFPTGEVLELAGRGHNTVLYDRDAQDAVLERVAAALLPLPAPRSA